MNADVFMAGFNCNFLPDCIKCEKQSQTNVQ